MKITPFLVIRIILILFLVIGLFLVFLLFYLDISHFASFFIAGCFIVIPSYILYGLYSGIPISVKTIKNIEERRESVWCSKEAITLSIPLFDITLILPWNKIETILYTYNSDDDKSRFIIYLSEIPYSIRSENPWWLNRICPFKPKKRIEIKDECKNFKEIPEMVKLYLSSIFTEDLNEDYRKGELLYSKTIIKRDSINVEQFWKSGKSKNTKVLVFDKYGRGIEEIF